MGLIELLVVGVLLLLLLGAVPAWPYSRSWGFVPAGGVALLLVIAVVVWLFTGGYVR